MFKAKLIETPEYYEWRRSLLGWSFLGAPLAGGTFFLSDDLSVSWWAVGLLATGGGFLAQYAQYQLQQRIKGATGERRIEVSPETIRILNASGETEQSLPVGAADAIVLQNRFQLPEESLRDIFKELKGEPQRDCLIYLAGEEEQRFDFLIDSYYMLEQLKKVVGRWKEAGVSLQTGEEEMAGPEKSFSE